MPTLCFLSMDDIVQKKTDMEVDDDLAIKPLGDLGWDVEIVSWKANNVDWKKYQAVIIRSTWDYQDDPTEFLSTLRHIQQQTRLENPVEIVEWNLSKKYLQELEDKGVAIVPTIFAKEQSITKELFEGWQKHFGSNGLIIKPLISATAGHTYRLKEFLPHLADIFHKERPYMVQPFLEAIVTEGEYSLFYFNNTLSHIMSKKPKEGDFRVQEDFGGINRLVDISPTASSDDTHLKQRLVAAGDLTLQHVGRDLLYARVDLVRSAATDGDDKDTFLLMELELIEPSLYMRMDQDIPLRFAKAVDSSLKTEK